MVLEKHAIPFRLLVCLLVCILVFNITVMPVRATAVLYEVLATTARSMIASLIRSCGVYVADGIESTLSSGLRSFESLTDSVLTYVWERMPDNLKLVNYAGSLMIKMVLRNGVYYAPRSVVDLVCDGISSETGITSGANVDYATKLGFLLGTTDDLNLFNQYMNYASIGTIPNGQRLQSGDWSTCHVIRFDAKKEIYTGEPYNGRIPEGVWFVFTDSDSIVGTQLDGEKLHIIFPTSASFVIVLANIDSDTGERVVYYNDFYTAPAEFIEYVNSFTKYKVTRQEGITPSAAFPDLSYEDDVATVDSSWASKSISVTDDKLDTSAVSMVPVSVYDPTSAATVPKSDVTSGSVVESETVSVTEPVSDTTTDVITETGFWSSVLGWFDRILTAIKSLIGGITTPIVNSLSQVVAAVKAAAVSITDSLIPKYDNLGFYSLPGIKDFFPFCIPFDLYAFLCVLCAEPEAPVFTFATSFLGQLYEVDIDLSAWDDVAATVRYVVIAIYVVGLAHLTRKLVKW